MVFQGWCCYDHVIHVTHHKIPVLICHSGQSLSHQSLKRGRCVAQAEGHPLPLVQSQFTRESGLFSILLPQRDLPEGRTQVQCGEELGITKFREALVYLRYRVRIFYRHRVQVAKFATKPKLPLSFLPLPPRMTMVFSRVLSCRIRATFQSLLGTLATYVASFVLCLLCGERRLPQVRFRVRRSYSNRYPPYVLKKHPRSDLKPPAIIRNLPRLFSFSSVLFRTSLKTDSDFIENSS